MIGAHAEYLEWTGGTKGHVQGCGAIFRFVAVRAVLNQSLGEADKELKNRFLAWTYPHNHGSGHKPSHAIRKDGWKLIRSDQGKQFELYKLDKDIGEKKDLAEQYPEKVKALNKELLQWIKETTPAKN